MAGIERFLAPVSEAKPGGQSLRASDLYDKIKAARKLEDTAPKGAWEEKSESKGADYKLVIKLAEDALITKSKDLQLAAWLTDAWIYVHGVQGLTNGLQLFHGLLEQFWDTLYPELEDDDEELRVGPIDWVGSYFDPGKSSSPILALKRLPLTQTGYDYLIYSESRRIGSEKEVQGNDARTKARAAAIAEKKITPEVFDSDFEATKKPFYKDLEQGFKDAADALQQLDELCREKFKSTPPSFTPLRKAIDETANVAHILLLEKLKKEPDVAAPQPVAAIDNADGNAEGQPVTATIALPIAAQIDLSHFKGGAIDNAQQAVLHVLVAAQYLRKANPGNPAPYLLLRALRWGEVRAAADLNSADLTAPTPEVRMMLRAAAANAQWSQVLEVAESAMSNTSGRGWLDLQRYAIKACEELGHSAAAKALRSELKSYLLDFPELPKATLTDDTGTANPETLAWLRQEGLMNGG